MFTNCILQCEVVCAPPPALPLSSDPWDGSPAPVLTSRKASGETQPGLLSVWPAGWLALTDLETGSDLATIGRFTASRALSRLSTDL